MKVINEFRGPYKFLSNFYSTPVKYDGIVYPSVENAFQAAKLPKELRDSVAGYMTSCTPNEAKKFGRKVKLPSNWDQERKVIMRKLVKEKFKSNAWLTKKLKDTAPAILIEGNTWHDNDWGDCKCEKCIGIQGKNMLGQILMDIRDEL